MENFAFYLLKSDAWIAGFALIYFLFLKNERYFVLNRMYLLLGILCALAGPFITWHYVVEVNSATLASVRETTAILTTEIDEPGISFSIRSVLLILYLAGASFMVFRLFLQTLPVLQLVRTSKDCEQGGLKIIRSDRFQSSFSFISYAFVNPSTDKTELLEIVKHEQEHIRQKHWIDLLLLELLRTVQWFNPLVWFYGRLVRQNHEYLADKQALKKSLNPGIYRAVLLNQTLGESVIPLSNSFNYSFNKKRFNMMKHTIQSPLRKLKLLLIVPVFAGIFYAFAIPEYQNNTASEVQDEKTKETAIRIGDITWEGNSVYTVDELNQALGLKKGNVIDQRQFDKLLHEGILTNIYQDKGYLFYKLEAIPTKKADGSTDFTFRIFEGKECKFGKIEIEGNTKVSSGDILKSLPIQTGDIFSTDNLGLVLHKIVEAGKLDLKMVKFRMHSDPDLGEVSIVFDVTEN